MNVNYEKEFLEMFGFKNMYEIFTNTVDLFKLESSLLILNANSKFLNLYYYFFANSILEMNVIIEESKKNKKNIITHEKMMMMKIYSFWYDYMPYFLDYSTFFETMKYYSYIKNVDEREVLFEIKHTSSNSTYTTVVSPKWLKEQHTYGQLVQSLNDLVKNKSNARIHNIVCVAIADKCELTEFYKNFKHSLNVIKMTSAQFCMYLILKKPEYSKIIKIDDTITFTDIDFEETTFKNIQYIN